MLPKIATEKQRLVYDYALRNPYSIFAVDPRLGKTLVAIYLQKRINKNCLVICPGYIVPNWPLEIKKWRGDKVQVTAFTEGKHIYEPFDSDFVIISYDMIKKAEHLFEWAEMIILDEAHHLKSMATVKTQTIHKGIYENSIKRVHPMTGTILVNRVPEFYSPLALMNYDPRLKDQSKFLKEFPDEISFADHFAHREEFDVEINDKRGRTYWMPVAKWRGLRNSKELKAHLKGKYIRVKADKNDLPLITFNQILISNSPNHDLLRAFNKHFEADGSGSVKSDIKVQAAMQKVPFTIEYVEDLLKSVKCVLIYSDHKDPIKAIAKHFGVPALTGEMSSKRRSKLAKKFQSGRGRILCATIGSLKEGENLFRARDMVLNDLPWTPGALKQLTMRLCGLTEKDPRTVHVMNGSPQDKTISEILQDKSDTIEEATSM